MIKNIIFDFGGVIYDIDHKKTRDAFIGLGISNFEALYGHSVQTRLFEDFETGKISPTTFRNVIKRYLPISVSDIEINTAWNALLIGFNTERLELLEKVKKHYRTFLLSNTNQIHYHYYMSELNAQNRLNKFNTLFDQLYFSHLIGMRKPDQKIFNFVLFENQIKAEETLFIDDYDLNIAASNNVGLQGLWLKPKQDLLDLFTNTGQLK